MVEGVLGVTASTTLGLIRTVALQRSLARDWKPSTRPLRLGSHGGMPLHTLLQSRFNQGHALLKGNFGGGHDKLVQLLHANFRHLLRLGGCLLLSCIVRVS